MRMKLNGFLIRLVPSKWEKMIFKNYEYIYILRFLKNYLHPAEAGFKQNN
jgi:hypothetical protein